jgi:hypothetical protein
MLLKGVPSSDQGWIYNYDLGSRLALKASEQAEETQPHASLDLYQQHVERLIAAREDGGEETIKQLAATSQKFEHSTKDLVKWSSGQTISPRSVNAIVDCTP